MSMTKEKYDAALEAFRAFAGGRIQEQDFLPVRSHRQPYRLAHLTVDKPREETDEQFADRVRAVALLAMRVGGYLTMHTQSGEREIGVSVSRDLVAAKIGDEEDEVVVRPVGKSAADYGATGTASLREVAPDAG